MAVICRLLGIAWVLLIALSPGLDALEVPPLRGRVNDYAGLLSPERSRQLERRLAAFERETGHQVVVLTVPTLEGEAIESFGIRVADTWKIGKKGHDNGVIFLVVPQDRALRLEVGYGLEGVLPDAIASRVIREIVIPRFRAGDFEGGIAAGTEAVLKIIQGEPLPEAARRRQTPETGTWMPLLMIAFLILPMILGSVSFRGRRRRRGIWVTHGGRGHPFGRGGGFGGGGFGGGGGGFGGGGASGRW